ncbi:MAG: hypothetical protein IPN53_01635 [Comamonadaceae bacterium]|nr:hypothetical protein [Comamonadaceae bacterium]
MATKLKTAANSVTQPQPQRKRRSNAQRQVDYRTRHLKDVNGQLDRLSVLVVAADRKLSHK